MTGRERAKTGAPLSRGRAEIENREINAALAEPAIRKRLDEPTVIPLVFSVAAETDKWAKVIEAANLRAQWGACLPNVTGARLATLE